MKGNAAAASSSIIVHLLKSCAARPHTPGSSSLTLSSLQHLVCLLEQYYHPSNTGKQGELSVTIPATVWIPASVRMVRQIWMEDGGALETVQLSCDA